MSRNLPFKNPNDKFNISLFKDYILPLAKWFFNSSQDGVFLKTTNSAWEAAYSINYLMSIDKIVKQNPSLKEYIKDDAFLKTQEQITKTIEWLTQEPRVCLFSYEQEKTNEGGQYCSWEKNTWDTSVVIDAIVKSYDYYGEEILGNEETKQKIQSIVKKAINWLFYEFEERQKEYSVYAFGANDFAPILSIIMTLIKSSWTVELLRDNEKLGSRGYKKKLLEHADHMVDYFFHGKEIDFDENNAPVAVHWGDNFITAEVSTALVRYFDYAYNENVLTSNQAQEVYSVLKKIAHWYEKSQNFDGLWGSHDDTMQSLRAYLRVTSCLKKFEKWKQNFFEKDKNVDERLSMTIEDHKVFKSIRWLLDEKQCVADKSYLHTSYLTVFFGQTLITIFREWEFSRESNGEDKDIYTLYDELIGISPMRSAGERSKNVQLELEISKLKTSLKEHREKQRLLVVFYFILVSVLIAISTVITLGIVRFENGGMAILNDERFFGIIDVISIILTLILTYFVLRRFKDNNNDE